MRMRLIDAEPLKELFPDNGEGSWTYNATIKAYIDAQPTIQPDIIHCKDCKHRWTYKCMDSMPIERCDLEQTFYDAEHDFCSLAERRADDQRRSNQKI